MIFAQVYPAQPQSSIQVEQLDGHGSSLVVTMFTCECVTDVSLLMCKHPSPVSSLSLSVPCTPNIGSVVLDCFTNSALLDWTYAEGALNYTATARSSSGHVSTCSNNFTNCELKDLQCGQIYNVITEASNEMCSSPPSARLQVESGELS